ncbi:MAG: DUF885 domain-containing protein [Planctomycetota bacterium]
MVIRRLVPVLLLPAALLVPGLLACQGVDEALDPHEPRELDLWTDAAAGVGDPHLATVVAEAWDAWLAAHPLAATLLGDPRFDGRLPEVSPNALQAREKRIDELRAALAQVPPGRLSPADQVTRQMLDQDLAAEAERIDLGLHFWRVDSVGGPHLALYDAALWQPIRTAVDRERYAQRWSRVDDFLRQIGRNLELGRRTGRVATHTAVQETIAQLEALLAVRPMDTPMVQRAAGGGQWVDLPPGGSVAAVAHEHLGDARDQRLLRTLNPHLQDGSRIAAGTRVLLPIVGDPLTPAERGEFLAATLRAVEEHVYPGLAAFRDLLRDEILPAARADERPGLTHLPGGDAAYRVLVRQHTSLPAAECEPRAIHDYGLAEVTRIRAEIASLGEKVLGTGDVAAIQRKLRHDPALFFRTREEMTARAVEALHRARVRAPEFFGPLPAARCEVAPVPAHAERNGASASYGPADAEGSRPGVYFVNTFAPEKRPIYAAEAIAFHESIPGRHLQAGRQQEARDLPRFRRHREGDAFAAGWALYVEDVCDEMGLCSSDLDRFGLLSLAARGAARVVVDTGLHAFGWSRDQAIAYFYANTLLDADTAENEVDSMIARPGEALAGKVGQREILALRDHARSVQGAGFSYPAFHAEILRRGAVPLAILRAAIGEWLGTPVPAPAGGE